MVAMGRYWRGPLLLTLALAMPILLLGIGWGLPSRAGDSFLFGDHPIWSGQKILSLAGGWPDTRDVGADVALHPLSQRSRLLTLNDDDVARARIIVRYRLYSNQPDELSTFRALSRIRPGHAPRGGMDPGLYQYGGLWIYPIGLLLRLGALCRLITLRSDVAFYIDHPDAFARFYIVARAYSALWGLAGVAVVFTLVRRICNGSNLPAVIAALLFACLPVVVNGAHEAKPHLGGTVLILATALAGSIYVERGTLRALIVAGALAGAAMGMVLSGIVGLAVLPIMVVLRRASLRERVRHVLIAGLVAGAAYCITNPYVLINLIANRGVLRSNLGTTAGMYHAGLSAGALANAARLVLEGTSPLLGVLGLAGALLLGARAFRHRHDSDVEAVRRRTGGLLLAAPALWVAIQFIVFAANKPGEYGRFAMLLDVALMIEAVVAIYTFAMHDALRWTLSAVLLASTGFFGLQYLGGYRADAGAQTSRLAWATQLEAQRHLGARSLAIVAEPAPYCLPAVNLFDWRIVLLPGAAAVDDASQPQDCRIRTVDICPDSSLLQRWTSTSISWADKPFELTTSDGQQRCGRRTMR